MAMNYANGVQFWSVKDNTPANGDRLTDAAGNEISIGGGGGIPVYDILEYNGRVYTSEECLAYNDGPTTTGRSSSANMTGIPVTLAAGDIVTAECYDNGTKLTATATAEENQWSHRVQAKIDFDESRYVMLTMDAMGIMSIGPQGFTNNEALVFAQAPTPAEAISVIAAAYASFKLKITKA